MRNLDLQLAAVKREGLGVRRELLFKVTKELSAVESVTL